MMIDLKNYRQYSSKELQEFAYKGLITCGSYDMSDFLEHIFQGMISEAEAERIAEKANEEGYDAGYSEGWNACEIDRD